MNVLVIEPDHSIASAITSSLQKAGCKVVRAASAQKAIQKADTKLPDLVVLELALPIHNGIEFLYEFRSYVEWSLVPVIVFTTNYLLEPNLLSKLGVVKYLYKPSTSLRQLTSHVLDTAAA